MSERNQVRRAFKAQLRDLYSAAGRPQQAALIAQARKAGNDINDSTLSDWLSGNRAPSEWDASVVWLIKSLTASAAARGQNTPPVRRFHELHVRMTRRSTPAGAVPSPRQAKAQLRLDLATWLEAFIDSHYAKLARLPYLSVIDGVESLNVELRIRAHFRDPSATEASQRDMGFDELIRTFRRIVLLGDPGTGKSWTLRMTTLRLAYQALQLAEDPASDLDDAILALSVRCEDLAAATRDPDRSPDTLITLALDTALKDIPAPPPVRAWLADHCRTHQTVYLLDAFDEIAERDRANVAALLDAAPLGTARIIVSSRISGYSRAVFLPAHSVEAEILPFSGPDITEFVNAWDLPAQGRAELIVHLSRPSIARMAQIPLLLAFLCHLASANQPLPETRAETYGRIVRRFLRGEHHETADWAKGKLPEDPVVRERELRRTLRLLAFAIATSPAGWADELSSMALEGHLAGMPRPGNLSPAETLSVLADRVGILIPDGNLRDGRDASYSFIHRTFAEYLCAEYLVSNPEMFHFAAGNYLHLSPDWRETWLLAASYDPVAILPVLAGAGPDPLYTALSVGAEAVADMPEAQRKVVGKQIDGLSARAATVAESGSAYRAARIIGIRALGYLRPPHGADILGRLVADRRAIDDIRVAAARALSRLGSAEAVPYLRTALLNSGGMTVDGEVAIALSELNFPAAADALVDAINDSYWYEVRINAADSLWRGKQFPAIVEEWRTLSPQTDPQRHSRLTTAIDIVERNWGDVQGCIDFQRRKVVDRIAFDSYEARNAPLLDIDGDPEKAVHAAIALLTEKAPRFDGTYGYDDADSVEMEAPPGAPGAEPQKYNLVFQPDTGGLERCQASDLLARNGGQAACDALIYALGDADELVRASAANALAQLRYVPAAPQLLASVFREIDSIARDTMIDAVALLDVNAVIEVLQLPFDATDEAARKAILGLAFSGLRDRPIPIGSRRALLPVLRDITALAGG